MYCKHCGKEIADDSKFCNHCGGKQIGESSKNDSKLYQFLINHKRLSYPYIIWCLVNIGLLLSSKGQRYNSWLRKDEDITGAFYPFDTSLSTIFKGNNFNFSLLDNVDVYDFSELFFYTIFLPIVLWGVYKYGVRLYNKLVEKAKVNGISTSQLMSRFVKKNIVWISVYAIWAIIHIGLYIKAVNQWDYLKYGFYPFDDTLESVFSNGYCSVSFVDNVFVYDSSEFFAYTLWFPVIVWVLILILRRLFNKTSTPQYHSAKSTETLNESNESCEQTVSEVACSVYENKSKNDDVDSNAKEAPEDNTLVETNKNKIEVPISDSDSIKEPIIEESAKNSEQTGETEPIVEEKPQAVKYVLFPLVRRFFGSLIDKILILIIAVLGYIACKPYAGSGDIGYFMGLMNNKPSNYEYVDKYNIETYGTIYEGVDVEYQMKAREESEVPYIGYTRDFEIRMCSIFIIVNLIYYLLFELLLQASFGKKFLGGNLVDEGRDKLSYWRIPLRSLLFAAYSAFIIYEFRFCSDLDYYTVTFIFFLFLELPLFFTKRSLLDLCSRTMYIDTIKKEDFVGKYGKPDIEGIKKSLKG